MHVIIDFSIIPIGVGTSLSTYIAACEEILASSGLSCHLHANGTNIEGDWDDVFLAIRRCHETLHAMGVPRIHTSINMGTRSDRSQSMDDKVASVQLKLAGMGKR